MIDLLDALDDLLGDDPDAALLHLGAQMRAQVVIEAAQDVVAAIDQRHLGAEAVEDAGELDRDIAAALDQDALRQLLQMKRLVRGDHVLDGRRSPCRAKARRRSRSGCAWRARSCRRDEPHGVRVVDHGAAFDDRDLGALQVGRVGRFEPRDLAILVGDQRRPVEARLADSVQP